MKDSKKKKKEKKKAGCFLLRLTVSKSSRSRPVIRVTEKLVVFFCSKESPVECLKLFVVRLGVYGPAHQIKMKMKWNDQFAPH